MGDRVERVEALARRVGARVDIRGHDGGMSVYVTWPGTVYPGDVWHSSWGDSPDALDIAESDLRAEAERQAEGRVS